jgi:hypothetical protein
MKMNYLKLLVFASILVLLSCNKNDDEPVAETPTPVGIYKLTAFNVSVAQDLNNDGTPSTNQMNETSCFNNSFLKLNSDNTFTYDDKGIEINSNGITETIECYSYGQIAGTWVLSGNNIIFTETSGDTYSWPYNGSNVTVTINDTDIVGTDSSDNPVYVTGNISAVYTKQ